MRRDRDLLVRIMIMMAALLFWSLTGSRGASAGDGFQGADETTRVWKVDPLGVSPFLTGTYRAPTLQGVVQSEITLQNPTKHDQAALIIYYDSDENFKACDVKKLTPHDMETIFPPGTTSGTTATNGASMAGITGAFEVVTTAASGINFNKVQFSQLAADGGQVAHFQGYGGSIGTQPQLLTESIHDGLVGNVRYITLATSTTAPRTVERLPLHLVNFRYFSPPDSSAFSACVCRKVISSNIGNTCAFDFLPFVSCCL